MEKYVVEGGTRLKGEVIISGAKNAAVAIIPATVLAQGKCVIENIPIISDISVLFKILRSLGAQVRVLDRTTVEIDTTYIGEPVVPYELARYMRASYYLLGALLGRCNRASVSMPGGCNFGVRPIDLLLAGHIYFDVVSVGATINVMLAAVKAKGITVLENCAKEPHIVDLANCLNSMGADIRGAGTDVIKIHGVDILHGTTYPIIPDQIEAGTYMVAAAATGGDVLVKNVIPKHLEAISQKLEKAGATVIEYDDSIRVIREGALNKVNVKTMPHPGFPTDMQPQMTALLSLAHGTSIVTEGVWDNRFRYVDELRRMGAMIQVDGKVAVVEGTAGLTGAPVRAVDLRAGAAVLIAAMAAKGVTEIENIEHVERGYEDIVGKLSALGANIRKVVIPDHVLKAVL